MFVFSLTTKTQNKTKFRHFKKIICFIAATVSVLLLLSGKWQWPENTDRKEKNKTRFHALDSQWVGSEKGCYCLAEASASMDPSSTDGRQFQLRVFQTPDGPLRSEPGCRLLRRRLLLVSLLRLRCKVVVGPEHAGDVLLRPRRRSPRAGGFLTGSRRTISPSD